ncbi:hydrogenase iron-sulfur subunit [Thermodesulfobacteriota bacterium]
MDEPICIIGSDTVAEQLSQRLLAEDFRVILAPPNTHRTPGQMGERFEYIPNAEILACHGTVGKFTIALRVQGKTVLKRTSCIMIADNYAVRPNFAHYGLSPDDRVIPASALSVKINSCTSGKNVFSESQRVAFLNGVSVDSHPFVLEEIMRHCLALQTKYECQTYVLTRNLKVADSGLEALYYQTKKAGTVFIKLTDTTPKICQSDEEQVEIMYTDESVRQQFLLKPDLTVVDESFLPAKSLASLARLFRLEKNASGFLQADNVHRNGVLTNRKGILAVGPARAILSAAEQSSDVTLAVASALHLRNQTLPAVAQKIEINSTKCIRCLTCYRMCPYCAIELNAKPVINPSACEGCGICSVECPMDAIDVEPFAPIDTSAIDNVNSHTLSNEFVPRLVAFCCSRSAAEAYRQATDMALVMPENLTLIELPCAGALSLDNIYCTFSKGIDAVAIYTCHPDNCHSEVGNLLAHCKAGRAVEIFGKIGFEPQRILVESISANMGTRFAQSINDFTDKIITLGPSRLSGQKTESS